ncbi:MAG TPA: diacylglycerol kinase family protein [Blastocatellia bacterium]|jgi:YegS/Rv2252/BmrU family lipid kinase
MTDRRATIIYNPMSGRPGSRADDARRMIQLLGQHRIAADACATTGPDDATQLAREAVEAGADIVISYGGDGTLNEVIQGMAGSRASLAIWPGGTSNVVARELNIPFNIEQLADFISQGKTKRMSLGIVRPLERYFFMMAGIGLDASIARGVNRKLKRRTGEFAYWVTGIKHLFTWQAEPFVIEVDGESYESVFAIIGNGKGYGGGLCLTPHAKLDEPLFEVYILPRQANNFAYLRVLAACMRGNPEQTDAILVKGKHIKANSTYEPWVEADGELVGPLPMTFDIVPEALSVIVP